MKKTFILILFLFLTYYSNGQPVAIGNLSGNETYFTGFKGRLYFASGDSIMVADTISKQISFLVELTEPVISDQGYSRNFDPNVRNRNRLDFPRFPVTSDRIFFLTSAGDDSTSLWISDGTTGNATLLNTFDIINSFIEYKNALFFKARKAGTNIHLWKADNAGNLSMVTDLDLAGDISILDEDLVIYNDSLFFSANDGITGSELWKSDGTAAGTILAADLTPGPEGSVIRDLTTANGYLFFVSGFTTSDNALLYRYRNNEVTYVAGTEEFYTFGQLKGINNHLVFELVSTIDGFTSLYSTSGVPDSEVLLTDSPTYLSKYIQIGSILFFPNEADYYIDSFWKTNGTPSGTERFYFPIPEYFTAERFLGINTILIHTLSEEGSLDTGEGLYELSQSDLTAQGTVMVKDLFPGNKSYDLANNFTEIDDVLFFTRAVSWENYSPDSLYFYLPVPSVISGTANTENLKILIYPNPAAEYCQVETDEECRILLSNLKGSVLQDRTALKGLRIDLSDLDPGMYFLTVNTKDGKTFTEKIIKK